MADRKVEEVETAVTDERSQAQVLTQGTSSMKVE